MGKRKKFGMNYAILVWVTLLFILFVSFFNGWSLEAIALSTLIGLIILIALGLVNNFGLLSDVPGKIKPIDSREESLIVKGKAVHVSGKKNDGVLYLTNFNLVFESKSREYLKIKLQDIVNSDAASDIKKELLCLAK